MSSKEGGKQKHLGIRDPPKHVKFRFPEGDVSEETVTKEVRRNLCDYMATDIRDYVFVIQEIEPRKPPETDFPPVMIRFGYYRKRRDEDRFRWGSQTTFHTLKKLTKDLINDAEEEGIL